MNAQLGQKPHPLNRMLGERGAAMVGAALVTALLFSFFFFLIDLNRYLQTRSFAEKAARLALEGAVTDPGFASASPSDTAYIAAKNGTVARADRVIYTSLGQDALYAETQVEIPPTVERLQNEPIVVRTTVRYSPLVSGSFFSGPSVSAVAAGYYEMTDSGKLPIPIDCNLNAYDVLAHPVTTFINPNYNKNCACPGGKVWNNTSLQCECPNFAVNDPSTGSCTCTPPKEERVFGNGTIACCLPTTCVTCPAGSTPRSGVNALGACPCYCAPPFINTATGASGYCLGGACCGGVCQCPAGRVAYKNGALWECNCPANDASGNPICPGGVNLPTGAGGSCTCNSCGPLKEPSASNPYICVCRSSVIDECHQEGKIINMNTCLCTPCNPGRVFNSATGRCECHSNCTGNEYEVGSGTGDGYTCNCQNCPPGTVASADHKSCLCPSTPLCLSSEVATGPHQTPPCTCLCKTGFTRVGAICVRNDCLNCDLNQVNPTTGICPPSACGFG